MMTDIPRPGNAKSRAVWMFAALCTLILSATITDSVSGAPKVLWFSEPVAPDQTFLLFGDGLGGIGKVSIRRLADDEPGLPWESREPDAVEGTAARTLQASAVSLKVVVSEALSPGVMAVRFVDPQQGEGAVIVNRARAEWWQGDLRDACTPGSVERVFGRNLRPLNDAVRSRAVLQAEEGRSRI